MVEIRSQFDTALCLMSMRLYDPENIFLGLSQTVCLKRIRGKDLMENQTDEELMLAYQYGDEVAFTILYRRHSARIYGYLVKKLGDRRKADDVFQNAFLKLHRSRSQYKPEFPFLAWVFTICKSTLTDYLRAQNRRPEILIGQIPDAMAEGPVSIEIAAMDTLSDQQKLMVEMRFKDDMSFEDIAKRINKSPTNVRQLVSRAIRKLRSSK